MDRLVGVRVAAEYERVAEIGYVRFWVAEHHNVPSLATSATAVLVGAVAGATSTSALPGEEKWNPDIVILVLGTGASQVGSRNRAAQKPNLLNVAVTRARRRLIVIGDFDAWSRHRDFKDLAQHELIHRWAPER